MPKQYQVLLLGGPADGRRVITRGKPTPIIRVSTTAPPRWNSDVLEYPVKDVDYYVENLAGNKSQYFIATFGRMTGDEIIEALLKGYVSGR